MSREVKGSSRKIKGISRKIKGVSLKQESVSSVKSKQGLFKERKYQKYEKIVNIESEQNAKQAIRQLKQEHKKAKTSDKQLRIKRVTIEAANIASVMGQNKRLSNETRAEKRKIAKMYQKAASQMKVVYQVEHDNPKAKKRHQERIEARGGVILLSDNKNEIRYYYPK